MKTGIFFSTAASILLLGSSAVFAQQYAAPGAILLKPGQAPSPVATESTVAPQSHVGIVSLKPGETVYTAGNQDFGATKAGATKVPAGSFQLLEPGQAG